MQMEERYDVYIASPLFTDEEKARIERVEAMLQEKGLTYFSPMRHEVAAEPGTLEWSKEIFELDLAGADRSAMMLVIYYGNYSDTGTAFEQGRFYETGRPIVVAHVDSEEPANLMITNACATNIRFDDLADFDFYDIKPQAFGGQLY